MAEKGPLKISVKSLKSSGLSLEDVEMAIGRVAIEEEWEPMGPTPMPKIATLREWDMRLLNRYKPFYMPFCDLCCLCTYGKCDLSGGRRGACGIDIAAQQGRMVLLTWVIGAAAHTSHARHLLDHLIEKYGEDWPIDLGKEIHVEMPVTRLVTGIKPRTLGDLAYTLNYVEEQIIQTLSAAHTGQEGSYLDFESKNLHVGMLDHVGMEVADVAQVVTYGFPKGDPDAPLTEIGMGIADLTKPIIFCIGHNVSSGVEIVDFMRRYGFGRPGEQIEVLGLCCTALDITRYDNQAKIVGPISHQLRFIRSGAADVLVISEQCIHTMVVKEAQRTKTPVIAASDKACYGLPDMTDKPVEEIVDTLVSGRQPGVLILDMEKVGAVAVLTAQKMAPVRKKFKTLPDDKNKNELAEHCINCGECRRICPIDLPIDEAVFAAKHGNFDKLTELYDKCLGCTSCESECPTDIPIHSLMVSAAESKVKTERHKIRIGRGPILDTEIREVGSPIVLGEIPGVIAYVGCANYPEGGRDVTIMAEEFLKRRYIVTASGCSAMSIALYRNEEGKSLYEEYKGYFDAGGLVNVGSCVANPHISGAAIKIASLFGKRKLRANYEEIADYVLNRVGACGVVWGAMSQKAASIASGYNRLGIPVILGPQGAKYRRLYLGRKEDRGCFEVFDARTGDKNWIGPAPEHLIYVAETREEAMVMTAKLCIRPNDTTKGRMIKLTHYTDLYKKFYGKLPEDLHLFVRTEADVPITIKGEIMEYLKDGGWKPWEVPTIDPTLLERLVRVKKKEE